ncbi:MAG: hypothetical protein ACLR71_12890 [[Clostridium] scindens]
MRQKSQPSPNGKATGHSPSQEYGGKRQSLYRTIIKVLTIRKGRAPNQILPRM